jgi:hypothetical protein
MFDKSMKMLNDAMKMLDKEVEQAFKVFHGKTGKKTRIRIKAGSTVTINGAKATLLSDTMVTTEDPETLMGRN